MALFGKPDISKLEKKKDVLGLIKALQCKDDSDRRYDAANALGRLGDLRAAAPLIEALEDENGNVRRSAAGALGEIGEKRAMEPLIDLLKNDERSRSEAAIALGMLGDNRALPALNEALKDNYYVVRRCAATSLERLGHKVQMEQLLQINYDWMSDYRERTATDAAEQLLEIGGAEGVRWLIKALQSDNPSRFKAAAWALVNSFRMEDVRKSIGEEELNRIINESMVSLIGKISKAELQPGMVYLNEAAIRTLHILEKFCDASALPALNSLLAKVKKRRHEEGYRREYIQMAEYGGWRDNNGDIEEVERIIKTIEERSGSTE